MFLEPQYKTTDFLILLFFVAGVREDNRSSEQRTRNESKILEEYPFAISTPFHLLWENKTKRSKRLRWVMCLCFSFPIRRLAITNIIDVSDYAT